MSNQKINSIGLLAIFLVIAIPTVYGAVEPSIIINMESGQSEKPLQIKNSGGTIVFSVDTDGTVFPATVTGLQKGTEIIVLNNNFDDLSGGIDPDADDANGFNHAIAEFALPTTAPFWKITGLEFKTGSTTISTATCMGIISGSHQVIPLANLDSDFFKLVLSTCDISTQLPLATDTVIRYNINNSQLLDGGDELFAMLTQQGGSGMTYAKQPSGTSGAVYNQMNCCAVLLRGDFIGLESQVRQDSSEFYMVVYATPYG